MAKPRSLDLCSVTLIGNLVAAAEIRYLANPVLPVADIVLASHSRWYDKATNSYKEWTSYHPVRVIGEQAEQALRNSNKGDIVLLQGYLSNDKNVAQQWLLATYLQRYDKGFCQEINSVHCSGQLQSAVSLNNTEQNKVFAQVDISMQFQVLSPLNQRPQIITIERPLHIWGKQASYLHQHAKAGDRVIIDGKLGYLNNQQKSQFIDAKHIILVNQQKSANV